MTKDEELKELEKKAWRSNFQDGLWDIYFGLLFIGIGIYTIPQLFGFDNTFGLIMILMIWDLSSVVLFIIGKKLITIPRIGFVRFSKKRVIKKIKLTIFLSFMVGLNVVFLLLPFSGLNIKLDAFKTMLIIGTLFLTLPICVIAYFLQFERLYLIGVMGGVGLSITGLLGPIVGSPLKYVLTFCPIGSIIITWGIVIFIRFLKAYPLPKKEQA
ncbi:MAG: hypothetical protein ACFE8B_15005 [Candidatus Hermodarchaeota archaeon]